MSQTVAVNGIGYNIEIKYQTPYSPLSGMPTGQRRTIVRDNVFIKRRSQSSWPSTSSGGVAWTTPLTWCWIRPSWSPTNARWQIAN